MGIGTLIYKKAFVNRFDDDKILFYYSYKDFPGLGAEPIEFRTPQGLLIKGNIYSYENPSKKDLVVFCHGMGGGHRSYMREIETLCRQGYEVLSYDNVGCWESEGENVRGLTESINDLVSCLDFIYGSDNLKDRGLHIIGHSWGGYAAGNILNFRKKNIRSVTVISGFASVESVIWGGFGGKLKMFKKAILAYERKVNPQYVDSCSVDAFRNTDAKVLLIHSKDDAVCDIASGLGYVRSQISNPNVRYLEVEGKFHNPNYTADAVTYMQQTFGEYQSLLKQKKLKTFEEKKAFMDLRDFSRMTAQDPEIWAEIFRNME